MAVPKHQQPTTQVAFRPKAVLIRELRDFAEMPCEGGPADPVIEVMHSLASSAADEIERLYKLVRDAHALIQRQQYHIAEDILFNRGVRYANEA